MVLKAVTVGLTINNPHSPTVMPYPIQSKVKNSLFWMVVKISIIVWLPFAIIFLHYGAIRVVVMFSSQPLDIWLLGNISVYTLSAVSLDAIVLYRRKIRKNFSYVIRKTFKDSRNCDKLQKKWKIYVILTGIYVILMTCLTTTMSQIKCSSKRVADWWMSMVTFDSTRNWSATTKCILMAMDNFYCGLFLMGCCPLLALGLVVLSTAVEDMIDSFTYFLKEVQNQENNTITFETIREMRLRYHKIVSTVDIINDTCQHFVLLWSVLAVEAACFSITVCLKRYGSESFETLGSSVYYIAKYGQPVVILIVVILICSAIPEKLKQCSKLFRGITLCTLQAPITDQQLLTYNSDISMLSAQFQNEFVGLSAGGCFLLTKNFCLSFIGLGATYVMLLIQFQSVIQVPLQR